MEVDDGNASFNAPSSSSEDPEEGPGVILGHDGLCNKWLNGGLSSFTGLLH